MISNLPIKTNNRKAIILCIVFAFITSAALKASVITGRNSGCGYPAIAAAMSGHGIKKIMNP